ncbi:phosphoglycerate mutase-like protein [Thozetella sp. PMI_491]|nr:phosphoglycerate mutase-like protein [Thozetella sp. PMI_491]
MRLLLVRHGETVDNVAGVYAGSRDSPLTAHGVLQAQRLGQHLAAQENITHVFSSDLQRASNTAQATVEARQPEARVPVVTLRDLRERDFGSSEGTSFLAKANTSGAARSRDAETYGQMGARINRFIVGHLAPVLEAPETHATTSECSVVVVAHGIILNVLLWALVSKYAPDDLKTYTGGTGRPDYMNAWSNTGYALILLRLSNAGEQSTSASAGLAPASLSGQQFEFSIAALNETSHLKGLKKTRGGIGSARFDGKQKTLDSFFGSSTKTPKAPAPPEN